MLEFLVFRCGHSSRSCRRKRRCEWTGSWSASAAKRPPRRPRQSSSRTRYLSWSSRASSRPRNTATGVSRGGVLSGWRTSARRGGFRMPKWTEENGQFRTPLFLRSRHPWQRRNPQSHYHHHHHHHHQPPNPDRVVGQRRNVPFRRGCSKSPDDSLLRRPPHLTSTTATHDGYRDDS